jgi:hypothetical protein
MEVANSHPTFIVDGLGPLNPNLALTEYPELQSWLTTYQELQRTKDSVLYVRRAPQ